VVLLGDGGIFRRWGTSERKLANPVKGKKQQERKLAKTTFSFHGKIV
jgi:hypothetical protein